jgi:hypothetical protein
MMESVSHPASGASEAMFLAWFFGLPVHIDVAEAARAEIARLDSAALSSAQTERLRTLLVQATFLPVPPQRRRRHRH